jgi:hypothetical protein
MQEGMMQESHEGQLRKTVRIPKLMCDDYGMFVDTSLGEDEELLLVYSPGPYYLGGRI